MIQDSQGNARRNNILRAKAQRVASDLAVRLSKTLDEIAKAPSQTEIKAIVIGSKDDAYFDVHIECRSEDRFRQCSEKHEQRITGVIPIWEEIRTIGSKTLPVRQRQRDQALKLPMAGIEILSFQNLISAVHNSVSTAVCEVMRPSNQKRMINRMRNGCWLWGTTFHPLAAHGLVTRKWHVSQVSERGLWGIGYSSNIIMTEPVTFLHDNITDAGRKTFDILGWVMAGTPSHGSTPKRLARAVVRLKYLPETVILGLDPSAYEGRPLSDLVRLPSCGDIRIDAAVAGLRIRHCRRAAYGLNLNSRQKDESDGRTLEIDLEPTRHIAVIDQPDQTMRAVVSALSVPR